MLVSGAFMLLFVALFSWRDKDWRASLGVQRFPLWPALGWGAAGLAAIYVANLGLGFISLLIQSDPQAMLRGDAGWMRKIATLPWSSILPLSIFIGFYEELFFRGFLLGRVRVALGSSEGATPAWRRDVLAVVLVALFFGFGHVYKSVFGMVQTSAIGLVLGGLTLWKKSIWPAVIAHLTLDGISLAMIKLVGPFLHELIRSQSAP